MAKEITNSNFDSLVLESGQVALIDFWAQWCGPCRAIAPIIEDLSQEFEGKAIVGKVDIDSNQEIAMKYNIRSIPTILVIKDGEVVDRQVGMTTKAKLKAKLEQYIV